MFKIECIYCKKIILNFYLLLKIIYIKQTTMQSSQIATENSIESFNS